MNYPKPPYLPASSVKQQTFLVPQYKTIHVVYNSIHNQIGHFINSDMSIGSYTYQSAHVGMTPAPIHRVRYLDDIAEKGYASLDAAVAAGLGSFWFDFFK